MELVRKILIAIEDYPHAQGYVPLNFEGASDEEVFYHVKLLAGYGIIEATDCSSSFGLCWHAKRLTWDGHDFIEALRSESNWSRIKKWISDAGKTLTIETMRIAVKTLLQ